MLKTGSSATRMTGAAGFDTARIHRIIHVNARASRSWPTAPGRHRNRLLGHLRRPPNGELTPTERTLNRRSPTPALPSNEALYD